MTPFEREDLQALAMALDDMIDLIEKVGDMFVLYHVSEVPPGAAEQATCWCRPTTSWSRRSARYSQPAHARAYPTRINAIEKAGDAFGRRLIQGLFEDPSDVKALIIANDIYEGVEEAIDATDRVGRITSGCADARAFRGKVPSTPAASPGPARPGRYPGRR